MQQKYYDLLIVGAGPAGMAMAAEAQARGLNVKVLERRSQKELLETRSSFFDITPAGTNALLRMSNQAVIEAMLEHGQVYRDDWMFIDDRTGRVLRAMTQNTSQAEQASGFALTIERHQMLRAFQGLLQTDTIRYDVSIHTIDSQAGAITLTDGERLTADIIVGADGLHSVVRKQLFGDTGIHSEGLLSLWAALPINDEMAYLCPPGRIHESQALGRSMYYHTNGELMFWYMTVKLEQPYITVPPTPAGGWLTFVKQKLSSSKDIRLQAIVAQLQEDDIITTMSVDRAPLERFSQGKTVLIGDAAHPFTPYAGQGTSQAMVDVFVLGKLLGDARASGQALENTFTAYETLRREPVNKLMLLSRRLGKYSTLSSQLGIHVQHALIRILPRHMLLGFVHQPSCDPNVIMPMTPTEASTYHRRRQWARSAQVGDTVTQAKPTAAHNTQPTQASRQ